MLRAPTGTYIAKKYGGPMGYRRRAPAQTVRRRVNRSAGWYNAFGARPSRRLVKVGVAPPARRLSSRPGGRLPETARPLSRHGNLARRAGEIRRRSTAQGVRHRRVVMPDLVSAHINACVLMIAE